MRAFERHKAAAGRQRKAEMLASHDRLRRITDALEKAELPAERDRVAFVRAMRSYLSANGALRVDEALGLEGGRGIGDALTHRERDDMLRAASRRFLPGLRPHQAAREILAAQDAAARAARTGAPAAAVGLVAAVQQAAQLGLGIPGFRQLVRILAECHETPLANVSGSHVSAGRGNRDAGAGGS